MLSGSIGIGVETPTQNIEINSANSPCVLVKDTTNNCISYLFADDSNAYVGSASNHPVIIKQNNGTAVTIDTSKNATFAGSVSDSKGNLRSIPNNHTTSAYTLVATDAGKAITNTTGGVTVNTSIFSAGDAVTIINH